MAWWNDIGDPSGTAYVDGWQVHKGEYLPDFYDGTVVVGTPDAQRVAITARGVRGYNDAGVLQAEMRSSDGKITAGAGNAVLDANGLDIRNGQYLLFHKDGILQGWCDAGLTDYVMGVSGNYYLRLSANNYDVIISVPSGQSLRPATNNSVNSGGASYKWNTVYRTNESACPLPTSNSALSVVSKIKSPRVDKLDYGERHYFKDDDFPEEMKFINDEGRSDIELTRTLGVAVQAIRELAAKVEVLEAKLGAR